MLDFATILILVTVFILTFVYMKCRAPSGLPPGPRGHPIFGHMSLFFKNNKTPIHVKTRNWGKEYGGLFNLQLGPVSSVIITDVDILKEALIEKADVWSDRPMHLDFFKLVTKNDPGVALQNGDVWKHLRRVTMQSMRDFGVGKQSLEEKISDELENACAEIEATNEKPFRFNDLFNKAMANIICNVLFGHRYSYEDEEYKKVLEMFNALFKQGGFQNVFLLLPWYTYFLMPIVNPNIHEVMKSFKVIENFIETNIREHRETFDPDNIRDFVDMYLTANKSEGEDLFTDKRMFETINDLFLAGTETTSTTLLWAILFLIKHPHVQEKCRDEIRKNIGMNRRPQYQDRKDLPYIEATLCEVQRLGSIVPMILFHTTKYTSELHGYTIPKHTLLLANTYAIHTSEKYWDEHMEFKPERFLDENGCIKRQEAFMPFGIGKRACLGENLAKQELFLFVTGLLQRFEFEAKDVASLPCVENTTLGITLIPDPYDVIAKKLSI